MLDTPLGSILGGSERAVSEAFGTLARWFIYALAIPAAADVLAIAVLSEWIERTVSYLPAFITGLSIIVLGFVVADFIGDAVTRTQAATRTRYAKWFATGVQMFLYFVAIVVGLDTVGVDVESHAGRTFITPPSVSVRVSNDREVDPDDGPLARRKRPLRRAMGANYVLAGAAHFLAPESFARAVPPEFPRPRALVYLSGIAEILLGLGVQFDRTRRASAWGVVALLVAVFPANVYMATDDVPAEFVPDRLAGVARTAAWARLPFQAVLVLWAWWHTLPESGSGPKRDANDGTGPAGYDSGRSGAVQRRQ